VYKSVFFRILYLFSWFLYIEDSITNLFRKVVVKNREPLQWEIAKKIRVKFGL